MLGYKSYRQLGIAYAGILSMVVLGFFVRKSKFLPLSWELNLEMTIISFVVVCVFWEALRLIDLALNRALPFEKSISTRIGVQLALGVIAGLLLRTFIYLFGEPHLPIHLDEMFLATTWVLYAVFPSVINLGFITRDFIERWKNSIVLTEKLEREKSQVQFDNLKNQLNPHFLFNALTSLNSLIYEDQALASQFLQQLAKVYRYVLQNKDKTMVSLDTELTFIQHYVSLLETRFKDFLTVNFNVPEESRDRAIVPVTLQILIENALKHNIVDRSKPLFISVNVVDDYLEVSNNIQVKKTVENSNRVGLENLRSLYKYLTDKPVVVENDGERFTVKVPLL